MKRRKVAAVLGAVSFPPLVSGVTSAEVVYSPLKLELSTLADGGFVDWDVDQNGSGDGRVVYRDASVGGNPFNEPALQFTLPPDVLPFRPGDGFSPALEPIDGIDDVVRIYEPGELVNFDGAFRISLFRPLSDLENNEGFFALKFSTTSGTQAAVSSLFSAGTGPDQMLSQFSLSFDPSLQTVVLNNFAYENVPGLDLSIRVPEPTSLATMALGAAGLLAAARRRQ